MPTQGPLGKERARPASFQPSAQNVEATRYLDHKIDWRTFTRPYSTWCTGGSMVGHVHGVYHASIEVFT